MDVAAATVEQLDYVPGNGIEILIEEIGSSSGSIPDTKVSIIWDPDGSPDLILSTHDGITQSSQKKVTGDGTKKLRIQLENNSISTQAMGGYIIGQEIESVAEFVPDPPEAPWP